MLAVQPSTFEAANVVLIPRLDVQASAGPGRIALSENVVEVMGFHKAHLRQLGINPRNANIIQVTGRSMYPTLDHEDLVVVDKTIDRVIDEALYAVVYGGMVLVKRVRLARDGTVTLSSDNKDEGYQDEVIHPADLGSLQIAGRVKAHIHIRLL